MTTAATTHRTKTIFQESLEPPFLNDDHRLGYLAGRGGDDDAIDIFFTGREVAFLAEDVSVSPALKRAGRLHLRQLRRRLRSRDGYDSRRRPSRSASCSFVLGRHRAGRQSWLLGQSRFDGRGWAELAARSTVPAASELVVSIVVVHLCRSVSIARRPKSLISLPSLTKFPTSQLTHNRLRFDLRDATQRRGVSPRRLAQSRRNCADPHHGKRAVSFAAGRLARCQIENLHYRFLLIFLGKRSRGPATADFSSDHLRFFSGHWKRRLSCSYHTPVARFSPRSLTGRLSD